MGQGAQGCLWCLHVPNYFCNRDRPCYLGGQAGGEDASPQLSELSLEALGSDQGCLGVVWGWDPRQGPLGGMSKRVSDTVLCLYF